MSYVNVKYLLSFVSILLSISCVKDYQWKGKHEFETKLVVNSFLCPDSLIRVFVSETISTLEGYSIFTHDRFDGLVAEVSVNGEVYNQMEVDSVRYRTNRPAYILHRKPNVGDTVRLKISDRSGTFGDVYSETIIPSYPEVEFVEYELRGEELFKIDAEEADSVSKYLKSHYGVDLNIVKKGGEVFVKDSLLYMTIRVTNIFDRTGFWGIKPLQELVPYKASNVTRDRYLYRDPIFKDNRYVFKADSDLLLTVCKWVKPGELHRFSDYYCAISEDTYSYCINYYDVIASESNIFSEPLSLYSNCVGGYGILGSYSMMRILAPTVYERWAPQYNGYIY